MADIIEAVPIDKYFELFKPGAGGDGGFIRIGMEYKESTPVKPGLGTSALPLRASSIIGIAKCDACINGTVEVLWKGLCCGGAF